MANILVMEDQVSLCRLYQSVLGSIGHAVAVAHDGDEAIATVMRDEPDLIILDLVLPGMSGMEVARKLASGGTLPRVPLIITSASAEADARRTTVAIGADAILLKPFDINGLLATVRRFVPDPVD